MKRRSPLMQRQKGKVYIVKRSTGSSQLKVSLIEMDPARLAGRVKSALKEHNQLPRIKSLKPAAIKPPMASPIRAQSIRAQSEQVEAQLKE